MQFLLQTAILLQQTLCYWANNLSDWHGLRCWIERQSFGNVASYGPPCERVVVTSHDRLWQLPGAGGKQCVMATTKDDSGMQQFLRFAKPAMGFAGWQVALQTSFGILLAVAVLEMLVKLGTSGGGLFLIAPFGASAVLLFGLPNSPLAQPWSAVMGNSVSALVAVLVVMSVEDPVLRVVLATGLAVLAMQLTRSLHPPGGAVAMTAALNPALVHDLGLWFVLAPVGLGTLAMVLIAAVYAPLTGRRYPFRQPPVTTAQQRPDSAAMDRLGVSRRELATLLQNFHQTANIGVEDLARLISAAEVLATKHHANGVTCGEIMSRDLVTVGLDTPLTDIAEIFRACGFTSIPVVGPEARYLGVIFQIHLIRRGQKEARRSGSRFVVAMGRLLGRNLERPVRAQEVMDSTIPTLTVDAPISALLPLLADGACEAVPVLDGTAIIGIVTRTDLIAALAHQHG